MGNKTSIKILAAHLGEVEGVEKQATELVRSGYRLVATHAAPGKYYVHVMLVFALPGACVSTLTTEDESGVRDD